MLAIWWRDAGHETTRVVFNKEPYGPWDRGRMGQTALCQRSEETYGDPKRVGSFSSS